MKIKEIKERLRDILEHNHQLSQGWCIWCEAKEYPVDENGEKTDGEAVWCECDHDRDCAVTLIEELLGDMAR